MGIFALTLYFQKISNSLFICDFCLIRFILWSSLKSIPCHDSGSHFSCFTFLFVNLKAPSWWFYDDFLGTVLHLSLVVETRLRILLDFMRNSSFLLTAGTWQRISLCPVQREQEAHVEMEHFLFQISHHYPIMWFRSFKRTSQFTVHFKLIVFTSKWNPKWTSMFDYNHKHANLVTSSITKRH